MRREQRAANVRRMTHPSPRVEVVIDELILRGFPTSQRYAIGEALSHELERLFTDSGLRRLHMREAHVPALDAGIINVAANSPSVLVGTQVARAVYGGLSNRKGRQ